MRKSDLTRWPEQGSTSGLGEEVGGVLRGTGGDGAGMLKVVQQAAGAAAMRALGMETFKGPVCKVQVAVKKRNRQKTC